MADRHFFCRTLLAYATRVALPKVHGEHEKLVRGNGLSLAKQATESIQKYLC
jgi:hypothetical protein